MQSAYSCLSLSDMWFKPHPGKLSRSGLCLLNHVCEGGGRVLRRFSNSTLFAV